MFTLVCSNDQERHSVTTTYRHRFRLELRAVVQERRGSLRLRTGNQQSGGGGGGGGGDYSSPNGRHSKPKGMSNPPHRHAAEARRSRPAAAEKAAARKNADRSERADEGAVLPEVGEKGVAVTAEEFSEALVRCPEMLEAFGNQLAARFRHRHRPIWMAPFLRKEG